MKLTPFYLLFSLTLLGLIGQKTYEYKLEQDDKKEVFCKNALFLLQAPDSLSKRVVDFDLQYDSLVNLFKKKVFIDSNETILFSFCTRVIDKNLKKISNKGFNLPLHTFYISENQKKGNSENSEIKYVANHFYYKNEIYYSRGYDEDIYLKIDSLKYKIDTFDQFNFESEIGGWPIHIIFKDKTSQKFLNKLILAYLESYLKICNDLSLQYFHKRFCELDISEVKEIGSKIRKPHFYIDLSLK
jgi:hypothetical protein